MPGGGRRAGLRPGRARLGNGAQGYQVLYAQVGAEAGTYAVLVTPVWWAAPVMGVGAAAGHAAGRMVAARRIKEVEPPGSQQLGRAGGMATMLADSTADGAAVPIDPGDATTEANSPAGLEP